VLSQTREIEISVTYKNQLGKESRNSLLLCFYRKDVSRERSVVQLIRMFCELHFGVSCNVCTEHDFKVGKKRHTRGDSYASGVVLHMLTKQDDVNNPLLVELRRLR
jgi:hypothetical protein